MRSQVVVRFVQVSLEFSWIFFFKNCVPRLFRFSLFVLLKWSNNFLIENNSRNREIFEKYQMFHSVCDQKCEWMNKGIYITLDENTKWTKCCCFFNFVFIFYWPLSFDWTAQSFNIFPCKYAARVVEVQSWIKKQVE